ncbi:MAG TPA: BatD family protein, partial [Candidatus Deferrimicrobium sp.]|nr:BatD family protein [Candidatus Deferrimicrobium sp.]
MTAQRIVGFLLIVLATVTATSAICYAAGDLSVEVTLDRDTIGLDEQATLQVIVSGAEQNLPDPQLPPLPMFEAYSQGRSSNISIVNGRMSASATHRFILLPTKPGTFLIEQIAVVYGNRRYVGNPVEVTVLARGSATSPRIEERALERPGQRRDYFMEAVVDNRNPYVNQQVTLTLKFYTAVQYYGSPELTEPPTTGFWTEVLGNKAPYQQRINNRVYKVIERKYALFPTQTGELTIGRGSIRFTVAARDKRRNDPFNFFGEFFATGQEVAVQSAPITIN